jgi:cell division septal protein FtsQ
VRRATILLYMRVLLSTRAVNEQLEENERERKKEKKERKKEKKKKRKSFFYMPTPLPRLVCPVFSGTIKEKKTRERKRNKKIDESTKKKKEEKRAGVNVCVVWLLSSFCYVYGVSFFFFYKNIFVSEREKGRKSRIIKSVV